jgi:hypothetical protein
MSRKEDVEKQNTNVQQALTIASQNEIRKNVTNIENKISICDVMKNNTSSVIRKMESQIPSYIQSYSDLYAAYLHAADDLFGTCYISEKEFFDKLNIDQTSLNEFNKYLQSCTKTASSQIDVSTNFMKTYVKMRISALEAYDKYMHMMMDSYANMLSNVNNSITNNK